MFGSSSIDEFAPDPEPAAPSSVSLQDVVSRETPVGWDEAVAVVEELCSVLTSPNERPLPVPSLEDILIGADGSLVLPRAGRGDRGVDAAGRVLHALLGTAADVPMALRLFVTQSASPDAHASIGEFAGALAYFGKPARAEMIQSVYRRHVAALSGSVPTKSVSLRPRPQPVQARPAEPKRTFAPPQRKKGFPSWVLPAGAAAAVVVVASGAFLWSNASPRDVVAETETTDGAAFDALEVAPSSVVTDAEAPTATRPVAAPAPVARRSTGSVTVASPVRAAPSAPTEPPASQRVGTSTPVSAPSVIESPSPAALAAAAARTESARTAAVRTAAATAPRAATDTVYSAEDTDVQPPVLLDQQMPTPLLTVDPLTATVNRMELLISPDGSVESARMIAGPGRMPDMMLLSGAKMWKFTPAIKDGEAVRYRTVLSWTAFP